MSTPAFVSWWPAPRNLRPSVTAWLRIATSPIATANTTRPTSAARRAPGRSSTTISPAARSSPTNASNAPATIIPTPPARPAAHAHCRSRLERAPRARTNSASASAEADSAAKSWSPSSEGLRDPAGVWSRLPSAPTNCRTPTAVATQLQPISAAAQMRRSRASSTIRSTAGASSMYSSHFAPVTACVLVG